MDGLKLAGAQALPAADTDSGINEGLILSKTNRLYRADRDASAAGSTFLDHNAGF